MKQLIPMDKYGVFTDMRDTPLPDSGYSAEFSGLNFEPISYTDTYGRKRQLEWYAMASAYRFEGSRGSVPSCAHGGAEE